MQENRQDNIGTNPNNPNNSSSVQMMLDCIAKSQSDEDAKVFQAALDLLNNKPKIRVGADQLFASHLYNDDNMVYYKAPMYDLAPEVFRLSDEAFKILHLLASTACQNGQVRLSLQTIVDTTGINRKKAVSALRELNKYQYIAFEIKPPKGSKESPTRLIDKRLFRNGKDPNSKEIEHFDEKKDKTTKGRVGLEEITPNYVRTTITTRNLDGRPLKVGSLEQREKPLPDKAASAGNHQKSAANKTCNHTNTYGNKKSTVPEEITPDEINQAMNNFASEMDGLMQ